MITTHARSPGERGTGESECRAAETTTRGRISSSNTGSFASRSTRATSPSVAVERVGGVQGSCSDRLGGSEAQVEAGEREHKRHRERRRGAGIEVRGDGDRYPRLDEAVHWLRRLIFRGAWLDQRVNEGELSVAFDEDTGAFAYVQPGGSSSDSDWEPIELAPEPSWGRVAYRR